MISNMLSNKKRKLKVIEFITRRKLNICPVFITQYYFAFPKYIILISTQYFVMRIYQI